jgi:hypothetical protein
MGNWGRTGRCYGSSGRTVCREEVDGIETAGEEGGRDGEVDGCWVRWVAHLRELKAQ